MEGRLAHEAGKLVWRLLQQLRAEVRKARARVKAWARARRRGDCRLSEGLQEVVELDGFSAKFTGMDESKGIMR